MDPLPLHPQPPEGSHKKVIYFVRHAEATHNVREREAIQAAVAAGEIDRDKQDAARRAALDQDGASFKDAPLSTDGTQQAKSSGKKLAALFNSSITSSNRSTNSKSHSHNNSTTHSRSSSSQSSPLPPQQYHRRLFPNDADNGGDDDGGGGSPTSSSTTHSPTSHYTKPPSSSPSPSSNAPFRRPDVVLVSPLRRALMTATELFLHGHEGPDDPPMFLAIEALREKRTGLACDERSSAADLKREFPHVDFSDIDRGIPVVPVGEDNAAVRQRVCAFLDNRLAAVPGQYLAIVSHKGWLRENRKVLKSRVESGLLRATFDLDEWDTTLFGNAEVRVAAFRWQDGELVSVVSRSLDNAMLASAAMVGDGFEFALGPPSSGFSMFLADRTTKVHFISLSEGRHNVAIREAAITSSPGDNNRGEAEAFLLRHDGRPASEHPLYDARLTRKGIQQAEQLRNILAKRPSGGRPFTAFEVVIVSPLTRALETANQIFSQTPGTYGGVVIPPPRIVVAEECRERYGRYVCDGRRSVAELENEFPSFDFSELSSDEDYLHNDVRESSMQVRERAIRLLEWISSRPERCVAVVTHSEFLRHLFGQFGDTLHEEDRSCLQRTVGNCELRSVVLCSHGPVERESINAPASTVRVPSSSSLTSLLAFD